MHALIRRDAGADDAPARAEHAMNPLVPLFILILLPISAIGLVLYTDTGIEPALFYASVKTFVVLGALALVLSYGASRLANRP